MTANMAAIAEARGISRLVHIHCDHFEPETAIQRRIYYPDKVAAYLQNMAPARPSLFVRPSFCVCLRDEATAQVVAESTRDPVVWCEFSLERWQRECIHTVAPLADLHLHMHHEWWTWSPDRAERPYRECSEPTDYKLQQREKRLQFWLQNESTPELDASRFSMVLQLHLDWMAEVLGDFSDWCFVHGCWALQASDTRVCGIVDEISRLNAEGCRGDWTFPGGRKQCDPSVPYPTAVLPVPGPKAYDGPEARPMSLRTHYLMPNTFLVWNSGRKYWFPSIDYFTAGGAQSHPTFAAVMAHLMHDAPVIDDTLYLKTHAHSMDCRYLENDWTSPLQAFSGILYDLQNQCSMFGVEMEFQTVREFVAEHSQ